ncbi:MULTISPECIES: FtsK/SpoIIIE domain-containing protein [Rhodococcus]|uniref:FtsK/SpoIIIE domain-containing protein n=1 Tax=Rhodococcus TaxID=1827 RepID=UPI0002F16DCF|nr:MULTISPECIES: FtsK/SpoIIIE domain-containing protein [Rhodococcus]
MSATSSKGGRAAFAAAAARALRSELSAPRWAGRRVLLRGLHGLTPAAVFQALFDGVATRDVDVYPDGPSGKPVGISAIVTDADTDIIPFLVDEAAATSNSGNGGFAASLRTHFLERADRARVLLILAAQPQETIASTTEDATTLPSLAFERLCKASVFPPIDHAQPGRLIRELVDDYVNRLLATIGAPDWEEAERLGEWVARHRDDTDAAIGAAIHELELYVSDPDLRPASATGRLKEAAKWRFELNQLSNSPGQDLGRRLAKRVSSAGLEKILAAQTVRGLDYSRFTLQDLKDRADRRSAELDPLSPVTGTVVAMHTDNAIWAWLPSPGGTLEFKLTRSLKRGEQIRLRWQASSAVFLQARGQSVAASVAPPDGGSWRFGRLELLEGAAITARYRIAVVFNDAELVAFEDALDIDADLGGFACGETPRLSVWNRDGKALGAATLNPAQDCGDDVVQMVTGTLNGTPVGPVPVIPARSPDDGNDDGDVGSSDEGGDRNVPPVDLPAPDGDEGEELGTGRGELPAAAPEQPTLAHAMLAFGQAAWPDALSVPPGASSVSARYGGVRLRVHPRADGIDLIPVEQSILKHPEWCMFSVDGTACTPLREFPHPEPGWSGDLANFLGARARYFDAALRAGSTYALDPRSEVARDYTMSYRRLLEALPRDATSRTEYDDLLLVDRVEVRGISDALLGPTSPLTVAWHAALADRFSALTTSEARPDRADIESFTPQHLLPLVMSSGDWYESVPSGSALLWRRYAAIAASRPGALERNAAFIANRIRFFLSVHPGLDHPENTLAVTFADADGGQTAVDALRHFFRPERTRAEYRLPRIRATLTGVGRSARRSINAVLSGAMDNDLDRIVQSRSELIVTDQASPPAFSSISFLFRSPGRRAIRPVSLDQRALTSHARGLAAISGRVVVPDADYVFATGTFCAKPGEHAANLEAIQYRSLELVGGQGGERLQPGWTRMITATTSEENLADWYDKSGWVVHLDRLVGIEAFADTESARTVLEYEEGADPSSFGYDGITGTRHVAPYLAALRRALQGIADPDTQGARALMRLLESVSGRWALQIVQRPLLKVLERAGTACAIRHLVEIENSLAQNIVGFSALVALEEIVPGFPEAGIPQRLRASRAGRGPMCDDLLLLTVHPRGTEAPLVQATVVEVKFWQAEGLDYANAADQVEETNDWLGGRFSEAGALADLRGRDLAELIRSARTRNSSFGLASILPRGGEDVLAQISGGEYELAFGHWRRGAYRRGLVIAVEPKAAGTLELSQLNSAKGPIELISIRKAVAVNALEMEHLAPSAGWSQLSTLPPVSPSGAPSTAERPPKNGGDSDAEPPAPASELTDEIERDAQRLGEAFAKYGLTVEPFEPELAQAGPSVFRFRTRIVGRLSITDIERRSRDLSREVGAPGEVSIGDEPGFITVDVPRAEPQAVPLAVALQALDAHSPKPGALNFVAGVAPSGDVRIADLSRLPHLLVSGATGSGKSVFLRGMLAELLRTRSSHQLRLMIIDPKRLDFAPFTSAPHLDGGEIIGDPVVALERLRSTLEQEIAYRQPILAEAGVSSAAEYYESGGRLEDLPQLVILVDEFADLVLAGPDRRGFSEMIQRYAQLTRAYGIFLVLATQRPSVDVITGSIKANLSARIAFSLPSARDSMTILDRGGAEDLLGNGDLLFYRNGKIERLQAPFATLADVRSAIGVRG